MERSSVMIDDWMSTSALAPGNASEIMTRGVITIGPDTTAREAARQLLYSGVHRLIVAVDDRPVGVLSQTDLVAAMAVGKV